MPSGKRIMVYHSLGVQGRWLRTLVSLYHNTYLMSEADRLWMSKHHQPI